MPTKTELTSNVQQKLFIRKNLHLQKVGTLLQTLAQLKKSSEGYKEVTAITTSLSPLTYSKVISKSTLTELYSLSNKKRLLRQPPIGAFDKKVLEFYKEYVTSNKRPLTKCEKLRKRAQANTKTTQADLKSRIRAITTKYRNQEYISTRAATNVYLKKNHPNLSQLK